MKQWIPLAASLLAVSLTASAEEAMYKPLSQRDNDPFVFCTQGMKRPDPCWIPMPPYGHGNWMYTWLCNEPNVKYGRQWTPAERQGLDEYMEVCSAARSSGTWDRAAGSRPEDTPFSH